MVEAVLFPQRYQQVKRNVVCVGVDVRNSLKWKDRLVGVIGTKILDEKDKILQSMPSPALSASRRHSLPPLFRSNTNSTEPFGKGAQLRRQLPAIKMGAKTSVEQAAKKNSSLTRKTLRNSVPCTAKPDYIVNSIPLALSDASFVEPKESNCCDNQNRTNAGDHHLVAGQKLCWISKDICENDTCKRSTVTQGGDIVVPQSNLNLVLTGSKANQVPHSTENITQSMRYSRSCSSLPVRKKKNAMVTMEERLVAEARQRRTTSSKTRRRNQLKKPSAKKNVCVLACVKPNNVQEEKKKFFSSDFKYNPQFSYDYLLVSSVRERYNKASSTYLPQALTIMHRVLKRYGNYEAFEQATGGKALPRTQLWNTVKRYLEREGFAGEVVVNISDDLLSRGAMMINGGRPTLSIRESSAKKLWVEGLLRHEIGTHHLRFYNNRQQIWHSAKVRRQMGMKPANPTEEGLASLHSVLLRKDPSLWRSATLYYTVYKASQLSFSELFEDLGQFVDNWEVRWDYCLRAKRGQADTSAPGCFCKDQVYLTGLLPLLQQRHTLDFHMLSMMGKISYEDIEMLKPHFNPERTKIPTFMSDISDYRRKLDNIVTVNGLEEWLGPSAADDSAL